MFPLPTLKEYLENPMGKGSTAIPNKQLIKDDLTRRYKTLKKKKKFRYTVYKDKDEYYFHIIVPSESERDNTYDVVLYFTMGEEDFKYDNFLKRYYVKFFSNCPSFIYSFAYVFNEYGFLIENLANKYTDLVLGNMPIIRNPGEIVSYEKSLMFACLFVDEGFTLKNKMYLNQIAKPFNIKEFNDSIRNTDKIEFEIKSETAKLREKKKQEALAKEAERKSKLPREDVIVGKPKIDGKIRTIKPRPKIKPKKSSINRNK
jgi:hypothetical protein